jgi:8-oxo-dGTP pyrophosphatase MutT (NUDIX family)
MAKASTPQSLSPIQNDILSLLKRAAALRYAEMKPKGVPNDLFNYHLQFLVKKFLISKNKDGYALTQTGIKHIADPVVMDAQKNQLSLYKLNVITIVSRKVKGKIEILNQLRLNHPSYGKIGVPGGVVLKGETTEAAASRKLKIETGLDAKFKVLAIERRMIHTNNELFSDVLFPIAYASKYSGELLEETKYGKNMWLSIDQSIKNASGDFDTIPLVKKILKLIKSGKLKQLPFTYQETAQRT